MFHLCKKYNLSLKFFLRFSWFFGWLYYFYSDRLGFVPRNIALKESAPYHHPELNIPPLQHGTTLRFMSYTHRKYKKSTQYHLSFAYNTSKIPSHIVGFRKSFSIRSKTLLQTFQLTFIINDFHTNYNKEIRFVSSVTSTLEYACFPGIQPSGIKDMITINKLS